MKRLFLIGILGLNFVIPNTIYANVRAGIMLAPNNYQIKYETQVEQEIERNNYKERNSIQEIFIYTIPDYNGMKTWMPYSAIKDATSKQWTLQQNAYTDEYGFRKYDNYYMVAIGTAFNIEVGTLFDLHLENGTVIPCICADIKADCDTDSRNIFTVSNGCMSEFIVDGNVINNTIHNSGDISDAYDGWDSPVVKIITHNINVMDNN